LPDAPHGRAREDAAQLLGIVGHRLEDLRVDGARPDGVDANPVIDQRKRHDLGELSDAACFSFYATKNITSGEGGAIASNNKEIAQKVKILRTHGMTKEAAYRYQGVYQHWDMIACGWKYNMDNIQAALLLPQLKKIDKNHEKRYRLYNEYMKYIKGIPQIDYPKILPNSKSTYHLFTIWVDRNKRDEILYQLGKNGIGVAVNYRAIHLLTYFREKFGFKRGDFPIAENIGERTISLPFYIRLNFKNIEKISNVLKKILKELE